MMPGYNLLKIQTLQPSLRPLAQRFIDLAEEHGISVQIVQGYRSPEAQAALPSSVTSAPAGLSYHQYGLAFDVVPTSYLNLPDWNPTGPLWETLGKIAEGIGLEWGGRWKKPDKPHLQIPSGLAPIRELKAYWDKFQTVMPIKIEPSTGGFVMIGLVILAFFFLQRFSREL